MLLNGRVSRAMGVVEPATHWRALIDGKRSLCRLEIEQCGRRVLDDAVDFGRCPHRAASV